MVGAILVMLLIPFTYTGYIRNTTYRPLFKIFYWLLIADFFILMVVGQAPITDPFIALGQVASVYYFSFFIFLVPLIGVIENVLVRHNLSVSPKTLRNTENRGIPWFFSHFGVYIIHEVLVTKNLVIKLSVVSVFPMLVRKSFLLVWIVFGLIVFSMLLLLFLIVTYYNNPLLFDAINRKIKTHENELIYNYWQDIQSRYFDEKLK